MSQFQVDPPIAPEDKYVFIGVNDLHVEFTAIQYVQLLMREDGSGFVRIKESGEVVTLSSEIGNWAHNLEQAIRWLACRMPGAAL